MRTITLSLTPDPTGDFFTGDFVGGDTRAHLAQDPPGTWLVTGEDDLGLETFNWFVDNGTIVIPGVDGDEDSVGIIGFGGHVLIGGGTSAGGPLPGGGFSNIFLAIRLPDLVD